MRLRVRYAIGISNIFSSLYLFLEHILQTSKKLMLTPLQKLHLHRLSTEYLDSLLTSDNEVKCRSTKSSLEQLKKEDGVTGSYEYALSSSISGTLWALATFRMIEAEPASSYSNSVTGVIIAM